ncbi:MAG: DUF805 domain-containing protein [Actinomycetota bacterium]|nr:DUF805 domain-containing protein [Actinomycetota bacterium]
MKLATVADNIGLMDLVSALTLAFKNFTNFRGRASRGEYWWFIVATTVVSIFLSMLTRISSFYALFDSLFLLAVFIPGLSLAVRRLHDTGKSGLWMLVTFVPIVGTILLLIFMVQRGNPMANLYGTPPLQLTSKSQN